MRYLITATAALLTIAITTTAQAFCGFYVARAEATLFNEAFEQYRRRAFAQAREGSFRNPRMNAATPTAIKIADPILKNGDSLMRFSI